VSMPHSFAAYTLTSNFDDLQVGTETWEWWGTHHGTTILFQADCRSFFQMFLRLKP
jgi:hypothetical protein